MKIRYDVNGNINAACVNSMNLGGTTVVTLADNADVMNNIGKYKYVGGALVLRNYLRLTTTAPDSNHNGVPDAAANASIPVTITAYLANGSVDTSANYVVTIVDANERPLPVPAPYTLVNGVASASFTGAANKRMTLVAKADGVFGANLKIEFI